MSGHNNLHCQCSVCKKEWDAMAEQIERLEAITREQRRSCISHQEENHRLKELLGLCRDDVNSRLQYHIDEALAAQTKGDSDGTMRKM